MAQRREHLNHPPIVEALIDLRTVLSPNVDFQCIQSLANRIADRFPNRREIRRFEARFGIGVGPPTAGTSEIIQGLQLISKDEKTICQFRLDGFTLNRLEPYTSWPEIFQMAMEFWDLYRTSLNPSSVQRLAVRYINRISIPAGTGVNEVLTTAPQLPNPIPQTVREFLTRVVVYDETHHASAIVTQNLAQTFSDTGWVVHVDIDAFRENLNLSSQSEDIAAVFSELRTLKNDIFFALLTERMIEGFK